MISVVYVWPTPTQARRKEEEIREMIGERKLKPLFMNTNLSSSAIFHCMAIPQINATEVISYCASYLSLLPALSEDLPIVAVAGIL